MTGRTAIFRFGCNLRLHDNAALCAALDAADTVVPVWLHSSGNDGAAARWWLHHSLQALDESLREDASRLVILDGSDPLAALRKLVRQTGAREIHWQRRHEPSAREEDRRLERALCADGVQVVTRGGALLHDPDAVRTKGGEPYRVFTPFWKAVTARLNASAPLARPRKLKPPRRWPASASLDAPELLPRPDWAGGLRQAWQPGEAGALARLQAFVARGLRGYANERDFPSREGTSRLSPHLHFGELSPRQVWHAVQRADAPDAAKHAFVRELGWREFAHHVLFHFPHTVEQPLYAKYRNFPWRDDHAALLEAWRRGVTGYPIVDAGMRQLWQTGWMHNRVRMIAASLLVKNLRVPWQRGAAWFMDTLVDADLANNTLNWQWAAGCGADAAPYFRIFNPVAQSEKFDAADYIREFVPELRALPEPWIHKPWQTPAQVQHETGFLPGRDYPLPVVDYRESREEALAALRAMSGRA